LDEPLSNLDARLRLQMREEIKRIQRETGITTVFVTHDQEEAMSISDTMVVLNVGVKQQVDAPQEMYNHPDNLFVAKFLGNPPINIFSGEVRKGTLYFGEKAISQVNVPEGDYDVGIRPEDFHVDSNGFPINLESVSHIGRDTMIYFSEGDFHVRALVETDSIQDGELGIKLSVKSKHVHLFDKTTGTVLSHE
jgi:multiple sugar transport system ATP-binding protein